MKVIKKPDYRIPVLSWCTYLDDDTMVQIDNLAKVFYTVDHVAEMADGHVGYGMPIGGVIATNEVVVPNAVGVNLAPIKSAQLLEP